MPSSKHLLKSMVFNLMAKKLMTSQTKALEIRYFSTSTEMDFSLQIACSSILSLLLSMPYKEEDTKAYTNKKTFSAANNQQFMEHVEVMV